MGLHEYMRNNVPERDRKEYFVGKQIQTARIGDVWVMSVVYDPEGVLPYGIYAVPNSKIPDGMSEEDVYEELTTGVTEFFLEIGMPKEWSLMLLKLDVQDRGKSVYQVYEVTKVSG